MSSSGNSTSRLDMHPDQKVIHIPYKLRVGLSNPNLPKEYQLNRKTERVVICRNCGRVHTIPRIATHKHNVVDSCAACRDHEPVLVVSGEVHSGGDLGTIRARTEELFDTFEAGT